MKKPFSIAGLIKRIFFLDFVKGLSLTFRHTVSRSVTLRYPDEEKWVPYRRFRGRHTLNRDERQGTLRRVRALRQGLPD